MIGGTVGPGDIKYVNQPNVYGVYDDIIDKNDMVPIGNPTTPEIVYGFGPSFHYKGFDLSFLLSGSGQDFFVYEWSATFRHNDR